MVSDIGNRLKRLRKKRGLSLRALGRTAHVSHSFIADIESGRSKPSLDTLAALAQALGVTIGDITGDKLLVAESSTPYGETEVTHRTSKEQDHYETEAAHRADDPMADLPEEARKSLEEFKEFILRKYGKGKGK